MTMRVEVSCVTSAQAKDRRTSLRRRSTKHTTPTHDSTDSILTGQQRPLYSREHHLALTNVTYTAFTDVLIYTASHITVTAPHSTATALTNVPIRYYCGNASCPDHNKQTRFDGYKAWRAHTNKAKKAQRKLSSK
jgi:hypothetical protein